MDFEYTLRTSARTKRVSLKVVAGELIVVAPRRVAARRIQTLLNQHADWISTTLQQQQQVVDQQVDLSHGNRIQVTDVEYEITWLSNPTSDKVGKLDGQIIVNSTANKHHDQLIKWLRKQAKQFITKRVQALAAAHGYNVEKVTVRDQSSRWGSCSGKGTISMNWRLIFAPTSVLDYVIVHELAHLKHMDHSKNFWFEVERMLPEYKQYRKWLKQNGATLKIKRPTLSR